MSTLALLAVTLSCGAHVEPQLRDVEMPSRAAPLHERVATYERLRPSALGKAPAGMLLASGDIIHDPRELAPLVGEHAATVRHGHAMQERAELATWFGGAAIAAATLGIGGEIAGGIMLITAQQRFDDLPRDTGANLPLPPEPPLNDAALAVTIGSAVAGLGGMIALMIPAVVLQTEVVAEQQAAFSAYEPDLRKRLALEQRP